MASSGQNDVYALTESHLLGLLTDDQIEALNKMLFEDPAARERCVLAFELMSMVHEDFRRQEEHTEINDGEPLLSDFDAVFEELLSLERNANAIPVVVDDSTIHNRGRDNSVTWSETASAVGFLLSSAATSKPAKWLGAAALFLLAATLFVFWGTGSSNNTDPATSGGVHSHASTEMPASPHVTTVATLTAEHDATWAEGTLAPGSQLQAGDRFTLTQGFAEITTARGAIAIIEAPATFQLLNNPHALQLNAGKLVGICRTSSSKGFVVRTDHADIIDLGTEFGVSVTDGHVAATVFAGTIDVEPANGSATRLRTHQTARLSLAGNQPELVIEEQIEPGFARRLPGKALVTAASINDDRFKVRVVPGGVREDAKVHTDRPHEINGLDADGLPAVLLGGDIIQVPADARALYSENTNNLEIEAEFSAPAQVYLLIGETNAPGWVKRDYTKTEFRVGFDQGPFTEYPHTKLGVGPGQSIDSVMEVWRRKQPAVGRAVVGQKMPKHVSYTLIAVPAERPTN